MSLAKPTVGNDPEIFLVKNGFIFPSEKISKNFSTYEDKEYPEVKAKLVVDNAAVEAQMDAGQCLTNRSRSIARCLGLLFETLFNYFTEIENLSTLVSLNAVEKLSREDLNDLESVKQFGCSPSLVFSGKKDLHVSKPNVDATVVPWRSIGFHVHLGNPEKGRTELKKLEFLVRLVQVCDLFAGITGVLLERNTEAVKIRRSFLGYGQAGEFREQPHGFEYRTLGPWPLLHPMWAWLANSLVRDAYYVVMLGLDHELLDRFDRNEIINTINNNELETAISIWNKIKAWVYEKRSVIFRTGNFSRDDESSLSILSLKTIGIIEAMLANGGLKAIGDGKFDFSSWGLNRESLKSSYCLDLFRKTKMLSFTSLGFHFFALDYLANKKMYPQDLAEETIAKEDISNILLK